MDMDIQESKARRHNERLFFESELRAARESSDIDKRRHKAEQALESGADRGIIDQIPKDVLPMVAEMLICEYEYGTELASEGWSPLHVAVERGRIDVARALVERGASLSARTSDNETPLRLAIKNGDYDQATCAKLVELFLEHGAPVDEACGGETLLHDACTYDAGIGAVRVLVAHGAEINSPGSNGRTPLSRGCEQLPGSSKVLPYLVKHGADIDLADNFGRTPLHWAMNSSHPCGQNNARWLLKRGAAFDRQDDFGRGALSPDNRNRRILTNPLRLALWRRLKLYAFGKPSKYTTSAQHRVAGLPELSHHIGAFLILRPLDQVLTAPEKAAVLQAIAELDTAATRVTVRRLAESIVGLPEGALDAKKPSINEVWMPQGGYTTLAVSNV